MQLLHGNNFSGYCHKSVEILSRATGITAYFWPVTLQYPVKQQPLFFMNKSFQKIKGPEKLANSKFEQKIGVGKKLQKYEPGDQNSERVGITATVSAL